MRALVVCRGKYSELSELEELARSAGMDVVGRLLQRKEGEDPKYKIGVGKVKELSRLVKETKAEVVIFSGELSPSQAYNLAGEIGTEVMDRTQLILEVFSKRSGTKESKLQVELAKLRYELPRAKEKVKLAKMEERPGFRGLGRYEVEKYYREIRRRMIETRKKLDSIRNKRTSVRRRRRRSGFDLISLAGYTNAGKSTLLNSIASESVECGEEMFTTIRTTTRRVDLFGRKALLTDTVGFIENMPSLVLEAFFSTIEEITLSDLVVWVVDFSEPVREIERKAKSCHKIFERIGLKTPIVTALNKIDLLEEEEIEEKYKKLSRYFHNPVLISAKTGRNLDGLKRAMFSSLPRLKRFILSVPNVPNGYRFMNELERKSRVIYRHYTPEEVLVDLESDRDPTKEAPEGTGVLGMETWR